MKGKEPWRPVADKIYASDPSRFKRIAAFIQWARSQNYSDEIIATGMNVLWVHLNKKGVKDNWWPYLRKCCEKAYAEDKQRESARDKEEDRKFLAELIVRVSRRTKTDG